MKVLYGYLFVNDKGKEIKLSPSESRLLKCLKDNYIATFSDMALAIYNIKDYLGDDNYVNSAIRIIMYRLRKKVGKYIKIINRNRVGYYIPKNCKIEFVDFERYNKKI